MFTGSELAAYLAKRMMIGFVVLVAIGFVLGVVAVLLYGCF